MGFQTNYNVGGVIDNVKSIEGVLKIGELGAIKGFPSLSQPFNEMEQISIPAMQGDYTIDYTTPDENTEILGILVSCTGYSDKDKFDLFCGEEQWYKDWHVSEMNEGLFLGTSTYVYAAPPNTPFRIIYHNISGQSKNLRVGFRMLRGPKMFGENPDEGGNNNA